jgi:hypothetical protein
MSRLLIALLLLITIPVMNAQNGSSSPYSSSGLGERNFNGTEATRHMGGLDIYTDSIHANLNNPASFGFLKLTTYSVGINYRNNRLSDNINTQNTEMASLDYLAISIPAGIFGFSFGLIPYSSVGYRIENIDESTGSEILNRYEGAGGINQTYLSVGIPITSYFSVGAAVYYNFGSLFYRSGQFLQGIDNGTFLTHNSSLSGLNYQFSAQTVIPFKRGYNLQAMYSIQPEAFINSKNNRIFYTQSFTNETLSDYIEMDLEPLGLANTSLQASQNYRMGLGFGKNKKWFLGVQHNLIKSATFKNDFFVRKNIRYRDAKQWTVGGFYIPNYASFTSFWSRVVYRFGYRTEQTSMIVNNIPLTESGISFGIGIPLGGLSNANIGLEFSQRGQKENNLVKESQIALRIGLSLNDAWFIKRQYN